LNKLSIIWVSSLPYTRRSAVEEQTLHCGLPIAQFNYMGRVHGSTLINTRNFLKSAFCLASITVLLLASSGANGQIPKKISPLKPSAEPKPVESVADSGTHDLTPQDLGTFLDGFMPLQLQRENIGGAVVLVVKDGKVLYQRGYGYSDVEKRATVSPDGTLFRPGSVSKLFTWTAVMQLVEQRKINLDADINTYLDFKIPDKFGAPITMRNLMTHTAGFEEAIKDLLIRGDTGPPLREYLVTHMPARVYASGTTPAYSNYGATLAGYIVQRLSGVPFDDYVEQHIFTPLGMTHSTFRQPLPATLQPMMSDGYQLATDPAKPFEAIAVVPAGSLSATAEDMSHFMIAHLQEGQYQGARILNPATVALMHSAQFALHPALPHMCLGFYEETHNGHRIIGHGGDTQYFHSDLHLMQDENLGFFVSYNSAGRGEIDARGALFQAFLDRYFPYPVLSAMSQASAVQDANLVAGEYILSRRPVTNVLSFTAFLENPKVEAGKDGTVTVSILTGLNQIPKTFSEIGPLLYREQNGQSLVAFTRDSKNRLVLSTDFPAEVATRVSLGDNKIWNFFLLALISIAGLGVLLSWPIAAWIRRHYQRPLVLSREEKRMRLAIRVGAALNVIFLSCWLGLILSSSGEPLFDSHLDPLLRLIQLIGWLGALGAIVTLYAVYKTWKSPGEWWLSHLGNGVVALAACSFVWLLIHWNLLHFSLNY
jgi:CubicO group peptidase (beta-lactamase class C family)